MLSAFILSVGAINALVPILVIVVLIGAAAGLTRGFSFLDLFAVGTFMGMGPKSGARASMSRSTYSTQMVQKGTSFYPSYDPTKRKAKAILPKFIPKPISDLLQNGPIQRRMHINNDFFNRAYGGQSGAATIQQAQRQKSGFIRLAVGLTGFALPGFHTGTSVIAGRSVSAARRTYNRSTGLGYKSASLERTENQSRKEKLERLIASKTKRIPEMEDIKALLFSKEELNRAMSHVLRGEEEQRNIFAAHRAETEALQNSTMGAFARRIQQMRIDRKYLKQFRKSETTTTYSYHVNKAMQKLDSIKVDPSTLLAK